MLQVVFSVLYISMSILLSLTGGHCQVLNLNSELYAQQQPQQNAVISNLIENSEQVLNQLSTQRKEDLLNPLEYPEQVLNQVPAKQNDVFSNPLENSIRTLNQVPAIMREYAQYQTELPSANPSQSIHYNKEFYYLTAPEEDYEMPQHIQDEISQRKQNLRVIFIRTPEKNGLAEAAVQLAKQSLEEQQTAIYVLTKQFDANDLAHKLQQTRLAASTRPEVVFVKYRTPQEAEQAQRTIQAKYTSLNGPNTFNHIGVAQTHNYVGATDHNRSLVPEMLQND